MRIAICDDEKSCREIIIEYLNPYINEQNHITYEEFESGETLLASYHAGNVFDIIFLDIEMQGINGIQTAEKIRESDTNVIPIFITTHVSFISETLRVGAFQFLIKPIQRYDFDQDFKRALEKHKISRYIYKIQCKESIFALEVKDIMYIEVCGRHLCLHANEGQYEFPGALLAEEQKLLPYNFVNCHQAFLVNMSYIKRIDTDSILLKNGTEIPLSKHKRAHVKSKFNQYLSEVGV